MTKPKWSMLNLAGPNRVAVSDLLLRCKRAKPPPPDRTPVRAANSGITKARGGRGGEDPLRKHKGTSLLRLLLSTLPTFLGASNGCTHRVKKRAHRHPGGPRNPPKHQHIPQRVPRISHKLPGKTATVHCWILSENPMAHLYEDFCN